jgi:hypothetical protein
MGSADKVPRGLCYSPASFLRIIASKSSRDGGEIAGAVSQSSMGSVGAHHGRIER